MQRLYSYLEKLEVAAMRHVRSCQLSCLACSLAAVPPPKSLQDSVAFSLFPSNFVSAIVFLALAALIALLLFTWSRWKLTRKSLEAKDAQLQMSEELFSKLFRRAPLSVSISTADKHEYLDVNEQFELITGYQREEVIGHNVFDLGIWVDPAERVAIVKRLQEMGRAPEIEFQFRRKNGEIGIAQGSAELIVFAGQQCMLGVSADVTAPKRAEQALRESERRFRLMADTAPVLMWLSGPDKRCTDFNSSWLEFTGRSLEQEFGDGWAQGVHPEDLASCMSTYTQAFEAHQKFSMEYRLRRHDGEYRWVLDQGVPRFLENGDFAGYIGSCVDITDEKEAKAARAEISGRMIHAQEQERSRIARELHDDINQRLALLANGLQELRHAGNGSHPDQAREIQSLWQLTSEIAADIQQMSHQLHPAKLHYLGLAAAARDLCQEFSRQHKIPVEYMVCDLPRHIEENVSLSIFRTIQEALRNVAKHSQARQARVELSCHGDNIRLIVADDGIGFDLHGRRQLGLGLISMQERMRLAGGDLSIHSRPRLGTRIEATVPAVFRMMRGA
jgi:PAS domain S-box-containing protein